MSLWDSREPNMYLSPGPKCPLVIRTGYLPRRRPISCCAPLVQGAQTDPVAVVFPVEQNSCCVSWWKCSSCGNQDLWVHTPESHRDWKPQPPRGVTGSDRPGRFVFWFLDPCRLPTGTQHHVVVMDLECLVSRRMPRLHPQGVLLPVSCTLAAPGITLSGWW